MDGYGMDIVGYVARIWSMFGYVRIYMSMFGYVGRIWRWIDMD